MAKIKIFCLHCGRMLQSDEASRGQKFRCPHCKHSVLVPTRSRKRIRIRTGPRSKKKIFLLAAVGLILATALLAVGLWLLAPVRVHWPDRRPIGVLFLASDYHSSATNPRGWFNDQSLDFTGTNGVQRFRQALLDYTDRSLAILKRTGAQGTIVWDLEGEEYPHKTSFIGDPRLLNHLAPEMAAAVDEFFARLRGAGLKIGLTIRPQQLVFDEHGLPQQTQVADIAGSLRDKIDYAQKRWGVTIFYVDSNGGIRRPDEVWQLRRLSAERPDILLIPEHHYLPYWEFSAPYVALRKGGSTGTANWAHHLFPGSFQALDIGDAAADWAKIVAAKSQGDILLFRAWYPNPESDLIESLAHER